MLGQKGVDPRAVAALHELAALGLRLVLANATRWPALAMAGVDELIAVGLVSYPLNVRKESALFYELVITAVQCRADQVLFVADSLVNDVAGPMRAGMQACLVRPGRQRLGERLPDGALMIGHVAELPALLEAV